MAEDILRKVDLDWLLCIYGAMLTDKQREIASLYYEEDFSLGEIAQQQQVSRQSVFDTLQRVEKQLRELEEKLGVRKRLTAVESKLQDALSVLPGSRENLEAIQRIHAALHLLNDEEESNGL